MANKQKGFLMHSNIEVKRAIKILLDTTATLGFGQLYLMLEALQRELFPLPLVDITGEGKEIEIVEKKKE